MTGSSPSATATGMRPSGAARRSARPSLWICQCMNVERRSIFCIRYMPTLRTPVAWSLVITAGSVMNGAGSSGQQRWIGSRSRSTSSPVRTTSWQAPFETVLRHRVGDRLELAERAHLVDEPLGRLQLEDLVEPGAEVVEAVHAERHAHPPLGAELVDEERVSRALRVLEEHRRAAALHEAVDDLGRLEVGIDLGGDAHELALALEERDPLPQVGDGARHPGSV